MTFLSLGQLAAATHEQLPLFVFVPRSNFDASRFGSETCYFSLIALNCFKLKHVGSPDFGMIEADCVISSTLAPSLIVKPLIIQLWPPCLNWFGFIFWPLCFSTEVIPTLGSHLLGSLLRCWEQLGGRGSC